MKISKEGVRAIADFEGFRGEAYLCPAGVWTIGFGHTKGVKKGDIISREEGLKLLEEDCAEAEAAINKYVKVKLNQFQYDALVSLVFNIGTGNFKKSILLEVLNNGDYAAVPAQIMRWNKITQGKKKVVSNGLVRRRQAEADMFMVDWKVDMNMPQAVTPPDKPLVKSRTMANATLAGGVGTALMVAPAIEPAGQVIEIAQNNTQGFLLVVGVVFVAFALVAAFLRWSDGRKA